MTTNEERRKVARCLRGNPKDTIIPHKKGRNHGMGCHEAADRFWDICDRIKEAGKYDIAFSSTVVLADLIEPEPERTCKKRNHNTNCDYMKCFSCSQCNAGWFEDINDKPFSYCPHCGAKVVEDAN